MKFGAIWLILILVGGLIPISIAQNQPNDEYLGEQNEDTIAGEIIDQLTKLSNFVDAKVKPIEDKLPPKVLENYKKAGDFKEKALSEYQNGKYIGAIQDALTAMRYYKEVLRSLEAVRETPEVLKQQISEESARVIAYFTYVEKVITIAQRKGINTKNLEKAYESTKSSYNEVLENLKAGNLENAKNSLKRARENRIELDKELRKVIAEITSKNAETLVRSFLIKTNQSLTIAEKAIEDAKTRGLNPEEVEREVKMVRSVYLQVERLAKEKKWKEALQIIRENAGKIERFFRAVENIRRENVNIMGIIETMKERIKRDATALAILKNQGINTARAELQLKGAINELFISINLLKKNDINGAAFHLQRADKLLKEVEEFINANS
ncbi:hypothetical protein K1720_03750 [Thermococcus argininiproducens]|uniref:DNA double-strand break repair Rad50 ATPase n=1 Tax=Thermococcus argininiproducens TaxID=2866384 RepID=A0A9E7MBS2_9EURY|nr:hypothetical protein [Thermococcus argininiproducens]USH00573.1 hypothetical protein K1720_03750 [Thermococcus argininiproducens]